MSAESVLAQERKRIRDALKLQYQREIYHPEGINNTGAKFDPAVQRFMAMRATSYERFKPTSRRSLLFLFGVYIIPIWSVVYFMDKRLERKESILSSGKVSYRDRTFKFHT
ncbi:uncharacterized protein LOC136041063 isoform X2 [Artemia franciscana]|nr:hypothetical protein QYM36_009955 [Artemia franciscana]